jgi:hypothetical protein
MVTMEDEQSGGSEESEYDEWDRCIDEYVESQTIPLADVIADADVIATVNIIDIRLGGGYILLRPLEVYKGRIEQYQGALACRPWLWYERKWFRKGEQCLAFFDRPAQNPASISHPLLDNVPEVNLFGNGTMSRLPFVSRNGVLHVICHQQWLILPDQIPVTLCTKPMRLPQADASGRVRVPYIPFLAGYVTAYPGDRLIEWSQLRKYLPQP